MKNKKIIIIVAAIAILGLGVWYFNENSSRQVSKGVVETTQIEKSIPQKEEKFILVSEVLAEPMKYPKLAKRAKDIQKFQSSQQTSTSFYGRIEDQHGAPVVGATITGYRTYYPMIPNLDFSRSAEGLNLVSDVNGLFSIVDKKINSLAILKITKSGFEIQANKTYVLSQGGYKLIQSFSDPNKPIIFHAWKKTEAEPLYYGEYKQKISQDGLYHIIDISRLNKTLKASFLVDPSGDRSNPLDWTIKLRIDGGGVIEATDVFMNEAPVNGYQREWIAHHRKGEGGFSRDENKKFYFTALNGSIYGRMEVRIRAYYGSKPMKDGLGYVGVKYWINPNGSRNLQYDPSKRIYPK